MTLHIFFLGFFASAIAMGIILTVVACIIETTKPTNILKHFWLLPIGLFIAAGVALALLQYGIV